MERDRRAVLLRCPVRLRHRRAGHGSRRRAAARVRRGPGAALRIPSVSAPGHVSAAVLEAHDVVELLRRRARAGRPSRAADHGSSGDRRDSPRRPTRRQPCSTATTTSAQPATRPSGTRRPSSRPSATARSTGVPRTPRRTCRPHVGALRAWAGRPPVGVKPVSRARREVGRALNAYPPTNPELLRSDAMLIAEGSIRHACPRSPSRCAAWTGDLMLAGGCPSACALARRRRSDHRVLVSGRRRGGPRRPATTLRRDRIRIATIEPRDTEATESRDTEAAEERTPVKRP
jgi:hypothetical protein